MSTKLDYDLESIAALLVYHDVHKRMKSEREEIHIGGIFDSPIYLLGSAISHVYREIIREFNIKYHELPYEVREQLANLILDDSQTERLRQIGEERFSYIGEYEIGEFTNESGTLVVSDPCYELGTWCAGQLENVATGNWKAYVIRTDEDSCGVRNAELHIYHESVQNLKAELFNVWERSSIHVGVDSGQAGFFDLPKYRNDNVASSSKFLSAERQEDEGEKWYSACCDQTLDTKLSCGIIDGGVVSSSGYGDGGYGLYTAEGDGRTVAAKIIFIGKHRGRM
jgi:hypothetical protein